jgi:hypothetical protein
MRKCGAGGGQPPAPLVSARHPVGLGGRRGIANAIGRIAQLVEQLTLNQRVLGSNPSAPTIQISDTVSPRGSEPLPSVPDRDAYGKHEEVVRGPLGWSPLSRVKPRVGRRDADELTVGQGPNRPASRLVRPRAAPLWEAGA